ncbi:Cell division trigger factor [Chitinispirillum alkaliphilum]|nr:Cell division trigger factor [Chitinispirillum alkaliphilum]
MKTTVSEPESWKRVVDIEVPAEEMLQEYDKKLQKTKREIKMPGFRPGKVPLTLIKQRFGDAIKAELVDEMVQKSYRDACKENNINPVAQAIVNDIKYNEGEPLTVSIETEVDPEIEIKGYDKLKVKAKPQKIKKSDVDKEYEKFLDRMAEFKDVDRPSKKGDYIRFEYRKVMIDGEEQKNIQNPQHPIQLGGETELKEFDKALTGRKKGEEIDVTITFPEQYDDSAVAGKTGEFKVLLTDVQEKHLPEVNEEFLKKLGDFENVDALKERIRQDMENQELEKAKTDAHKEAIDTLIKENPFDVPPSRIKAFTDYMYEEALRYGQGQQPPPKEELEKQYHDTAVNSIKQQRIVDYIAGKEKIKPTQEEVDQEILRLAQMYGQDFETLKGVLRKNGTTNRIRADLKEKKTLDSLIGETEKKEDQ